MDHIGGTIGRRSLLKAAAGLGAVTVAGRAEAAPAVDPKGKLKITKVETFLVKPRWLLSSFNSCIVFGFASPLNDHWRVTPTLTIGSTFALALPLRLAAGATLGAASGSML